MKKRKLLALLMIVSLFSVTACKKVEKEDIDVLGGWTVDTSTETLNLTSAAKKAFEDATEEYDGMSWEPIALLGTQVVSGTNYAILAKGTPTTFNATTSWKVVIVYSDLDGNSVVLSASDINIVDYTSDNEFDEETLSGGWTVNSKITEAVISEDAINAYNTAMNTFVGRNYIPIALLGTQIVSGTNYAYLVQGSNAVTSSANESYNIAVIVVYSDLDGNSEVSTVYNLDLSIFNN